MPKSCVVLLLLPALCAGAFGAEADPAIHAPAETLVFISVKDLRPLLAPLVGVFDALAGERVQEAADLLKDIRQVIAGRASLAILPPEIGMEGPAWIFRVPVDQSKLKVDDLFIKFIRSLRRGHFDVIRVTTIDGVHQIDGLGDEPEIFWAVHEKVLCVSNERENVTGMLRPSRKMRQALAGTPAYKGLGKYVNWSGDMTAFCDLKTVLSLATNTLRTARRSNRRSRSRWMLDWLAPEQFEVAGFSWTGGAKGGSGRLAALTHKKRKGICALLDLPNAPTKDLDRIPGDCQAFVATSALARGSVKRLSRFMADLDRDVAKEFEEELAEFSRELGVDIGKDLLDNLGDFAAGTRSSDAGGVSTYGVVTIRNQAKLQKCAEALANYNNTPS